MRAVNFKQLYPTIKMIKRKLFLFIINIRMVGCIKLNSGSKILKVIQIKAH